MNSFFLPVKAGQSEMQLNLITDAKEINQDAARKILTESFIEEYRKYLKPEVVSEELTCWYDKDKSSSQDKSAQKYYEEYFASELACFERGKLLPEGTPGKLEFWVEAKINNQLVGWATFEREKLDKNALYMNLLVVAPDQQGKGVGGALVKSLMTLKVMPEPNAINVLLRAKNQGGEIFYSKLGFKINRNYVRDDNFVPMDKLMPITWFQPKLENTEVKQQAVTNNRL